MLELTLHLHFFLEAVHKIDLSPEGLLVLVALPHLFLAELAVAALLLLLDFLVLGLQLLLLALAEEADVLFLEGFVHSALI